MGKPLVFHPRTSRQVASELYYLTGLSKKTFLYSFTYLYNGTGYPTTWHIRNTGSFEFTNNMVKECFLSTGFGGMLFVGAIIHIEEILLEKLVWMRDYYYKEINIRRKCTFKNIFIIGNSYQKIHARRFI